MPGPLDRRLLVVTGKGGVGKTTVAAALALELARRGKRTLLCEVNAGERAAGLLGHAPVGPEIREVEPNLSLVDVRPPEAMKEYVLLKIRLERVYRTVFENRMVRYFLRFVPSLAETVMLGKVLWHVKQPLGTPDGYEAVVVDAPATGHALTFLGVPETLLSTLPGGPMASEARWMRDLLVDPAITAAVLVTLPEELPVNETLELAEGLGGRLQVPIGATVLNQAVPGRFDADDRAALSGRPGLTRLVEAWEEDAARTREAVARLGAIPASLVRLPRLTTPRVVREDVVAFGRELARALEAPGRAA